MTATCHFGDALPSFPVMLSTGKLEETTAPKGYLVHGVQIITYAVAVSQLDRQGAGDVTTKLRSQGRPEVALHSLRDDSHHLNLGQARQVLFRQWLVLGMHRFHELLPDVMNDVVAFLGRHPGLRPHQAIAFGQGPEHRIGIGSKLQFACSESPGHRQGGFLAVGAVTVHAEVGVDRLPLGETFSPPCLQYAGMIDGIGFHLGVLGQNRSGQRQK